MSEHKTSFHSSKGNQFKWCEDYQWYKMDYLGYESLAEILVSELLKETNVESFVAYHHDHVFYNEEIENVCVSDNFLNDGDEIITIEKLILQMKGISIAQFMSGRSVETKIEMLVNAVVDITGIEEFGKYITLLLEIDAFFLNEDRHTHNLAVIRNQQGDFRLCPIFDNGAALLSDMKQDYPITKSLEECYARIEAKPFSRDFDEQMEAAQSLYGQQLEISFTPKSWEQALEEIAIYYDKRIVKRVDDILRQQYRKYEYLRK